MQSTMGEPEVLAYEMASSGRYLEVQVFPDAIAGLLPTGLWIVRTLDENGEFSPPKLVKLTPIEPCPEVNEVPKDRTPLDDELPSCGLNDPVSDDTPSSSDSLEVNDDLTIKTDLKKENSGNLILDSEIETRNGTTAPSADGLSSYLFCSPDPVLGLCPDNGGSHNPVELEVNPEHAELPDSRNPGFNFDWPPEVYDDLLGTLPRGGQIQQMQTSKTPEVHEDYICDRIDDLSLYHHPWNYRVLTRPIRRDSVPHAVPRCGYHVEGRQIPFTRTVEDDTRVSRQEPGTNAGNDLVGQIGESQDCSKEGSSKLNYDHFVGPRKRRKKRPLAGVLMHHRTKIK